MSTVNPNITNGLHLALLKTACSELAMKVFGNTVPYFSHGSAVSLVKLLIIKHQSLCNKLYSNSLLISSNGW